MLTLCAPLSRKRNIRRVFVLAVCGSAILLTSLYVSYPTFRLPPNFTGSRFLSKDRTSPLPQSKIAETIHYVDDQREDSKTESERLDVKDGSETETVGKSYAEIGSLDSTESAEEETSNVDCPLPAWSKERDFEKEPVLIVAPRSSYPSPPERRLPCPIPCSFTSDQKYSGTGDVILWELLHGGYPNSKENFPAKVCKSQQFALLSQESHSNYPFLKDAKENGFDLIMDYRMSADVPAPYYGICDVLRPVDTSVTKDSDVLASAFISNCGAKNNRLEVLQELMTYIKVDSFGGCAKNKDVPPDGQMLSSWNQKTYMMKRYKFHLSFENSDDEDYVTEKFFQPLEAGVVPVFLGTKTIYKFAPARTSYIDVRDFPDVKSLANHLIYLSKNPKAYEKYLAYKRPGYQQTPEFKELVGISRIDSGCRLCMKAAKMDVWKYTQPTAAVVRPS